MKGLVKLWVSTSILTEIYEDQRGENQRTDICGAPSQRNHDSTSDKTVSKIEGDNLKHWPQISLETSRQKIWIIKSTKSWIQNIIKNPFPTFMLLLLFNKLGQC
jgi:hypothetical protein